jgi:hypothetical protein
LIRSSAYHPQTDGQTERVNQILEDMLRACIIHYGTSWDKCFALAEFSYNNSYQASLQMASFEVLYGHRCRTPLSWSETGERKIFEPDLVVEAEDKVKVIQSNLKTAQSRQKSYADKRRKPLQFQIGDFAISTFRHKGEVSTSVCRTLRNSQCLWPSGLQTSPSISFGCHSQCFPRLSA